MSGGREAGTPYRKIITSSHPTETEGTTSVGGTEGAAHHSTALTVDDRSVHGHGGSAPFHDHRFHLRFDMT